jgi:iron complex outermembrane receptor protein
MNTFYREGFARRQKWFFSLSAFIALLCYPLIGLAQPETDTASAPTGEEVMLFQEIPSVYGASKYEQKVTEAPSSVSIVTASEIKRYGYRTLADVLRSVRSFYVTSDRNYSYVGVRGFGRPGDYNNRMLLLIDGHRMNDNLYDMALIGTEGVLDIDLIDRVEIIRGPGSSLYGSNALFAVVNVITKRGRDLKGPEVSTEAGRYDTYKTRLTHGNRYQNGLETIVSGSGYTSRGKPSLYYGEYDNPAANNGLSNQNDYDRSHSFFTKTSFQDITLEGAYSMRTKGISTGAFQTNFNDPGVKTTDVRYYLDLRYERNIGRSTDVVARIFYDWYDYYADYPYSAPGYILNKDHGTAEWWGAEVKLSTRPFEFLRIILGAEYTYNTRLDQLNYDVTPYTVWVEDKRHSQVWATYLQGELTLSQWLSVTAGGRFDYYDTFGGTTNPRLAFIITPVEKSVIKLLYGSAFRAPRPFELYYQGSTNEANPDLKPEKITTYELVFEQYLGDTLRATATGFYYEIDDLINQTDAGGGKTVFRNIDRARSRGLELELENKWKNGIDARLSYTLQRTLDATTQEIMTNSPEHLVKLNVTVPLWQDRIFASLEEQYTSERRIIAGASTSDFFITNVTVFSRRIIKGLELSASVYNLFDKKFNDPVSSNLSPITSVQQDGISYRFKLTYAF